MPDTATGPFAYKAPPFSQRVRRSMHDMALRSPLLRWRFETMPGDHLLIVPQALRTIDASFMAELESGYLGLAGAVAPYNGGVPFNIMPPNDAWTRELHGFGWLHHLRATDSGEARQLGEDWIAAWQAKYKRKSGIPWAPVIVARRLISILSGAGFILQGSDARFHDAYVAMANDHLRVLARSYAGAPEGVNKLLILTGIMYGGLCIAEQERFVDDFLPAFSGELQRQIRPDGSPISRETSSVVEIVLDLLPLDRCFTSRKIDVPVQLAAALQRAIRFVAHMRLGDGMLARFNGVGPTWPDRVAAVLAYQDLQSSPLEEARLSGYSRLARGRTVVMMDVGVPPPYDASIHAHAGCLSFEMSSGTCPIIVNCGAPGPADQDWRPLSRGTAAHSTLVLNDTSSSVLIRDSDDEARLGGIPIEGPERVERVIEDKADGSVFISAWHDGYSSRFGLRHERILQIRSRGEAIEGTDKLTGGGRMFAGRNHEMQPYAIRFHLHPRTRVRRGETTRSVEIRLANGEIWEFSALDTQVNLEESVFLAELSGPLQSVQLVLRGAVAGEMQVSWRLRKLEQDDERRAGIRETLSVVPSEGSDNPGP
ncbi:MAG: heparinase II/III family protein, partial [Hyphomicrobiaceae bacterium]